MTVQQKLTLGIGSIIAVIAINTAVGSINLHSVQTLSEQTATESVPFATLAADAKYQSCQIQQFVTDGSLTRDTEVIKEAQGAYEQFIADLGKFEAMFENEHDTKALTEIREMKSAASDVLETRKKATA